MESEKEGDGAGIVDGDAKGGELEFIGAWWKSDKSPRCGD